MLSDRKALAILTALYAGLFLLFPPQNFPMIDSWSYAWTTSRFLETWRIERAGWSDMSLVAHIAWGALFGQLLGFSFRVLNFSTLPLALLACASFYLVLREQRIEPGNALLGTLVLAFNPIFFLLSQTYMTDVPFLTYLTLAMLFYLKGFNGRGKLYLLLGSLFCTLALLVRQNGALVVLGAMGYLLMDRRGGQTLARLSCAGLVPLVSLGVLMLLWGGPVATTNPFDQIIGPGEVAGYIQQEQQELARWGALAWLLPALFGLGYLASTALRIALYLGLFLLPVSLPLLPQAIRERQKRSGFLLRGGILAVGLVALRLENLYLSHLPEWGLMPYLRDIITIYGVGGEGEWLVGRRELLLPRPFWLALTLLSALALAQLLSAFSTSLRRRTPLSRPSDAFLYLAAALQLLFFLGLDFTGEIFDRHLLAFLLPVALPLLRMNRGGQPARWATLLLLLGFLGYSFLTTSEYLAWNKARWQAGGDLIAQGIPPTHIDAGFEWAGWHWANSPELRADQSQARPGDPWYMYLFPQLGREYVISFSEMPGYEIARELKYRPGPFCPQKALYVLRRR